MRIIINKRNTQASGAYFLFRFMCWRDRDEKMGGETYFLSMFLELKKKKNPRVNALNNITRRFQ